jgi:hypothetical protein
MAFVRDDKGLNEMSGWRKEKNNLVQKSRNLRLLCNSYQIQHQLFYANLIRMLRKVQRTNPVTKNEMISH